MEAVAVAAWRRLADASNETNIVQPLAATRGRTRRIVVLAKLKNGDAVTDKPMTSTFRLDLPKDLIAEAQRQPKPNNEQLKVDGWRNSWMSRISELLIGKDPA